MGAGTPGCLETREVGNASFSKQPAWNKTLKAKNREARNGNEIKILAPLPLWGRARHPNVTNGDSNRWLERLECGVYPCTHRCVPSSRCLPPHLVLRAGPSPAALTEPSCTPAAVGELTHCEAQVWGYILWCPLWDRTHSSARFLSGPRDTMEWDESWQRRGQTPRPLAGTLPQAGGCGVTSCCHLLPPASLSSASSVSPHRHLATSVSPSHHSWLGLGGGIMGSILPSPQAAFIPGWLPSPPPPLPARAPQGWQENNSEEDE